MKLRASIVIGALLAMGITACDPYSTEKGGNPKIIGLVATDGSTPFETYTAGANNTWALTDVAPDSSVVFVLTNESLDPTTIQTTTTNCTPAGNWLTVTGPAITCTTGSPAWYSCYDPSAPTPNQGASVVIFPACEAPGADTGWYDVMAPLDASSTYHITGSVKDRSGAALPIDVTITTAAPAPAA